MGKRPRKKVIPHFELRFKESRINHWARSYDYSEDEDTPISIGVSAREKGFLDLTELVEICKWKSRRPTRHVSRNYDSSVIEITKFVFSTQDEFARIAGLTMLHGISWPTASVILHYCVDQQYPILDVRALWSFGIDDPKNLEPYWFDLWACYVKECREIAGRNKVTVRHFDKALWQYSRENQTSLVQK